MLRRLNSQCRAGLGSLLSRVIVSPFLVHGATPHVFVANEVDDCSVVELQLWPDGLRCLRAVQSLASGHYRLLGARTWCFLTAPLIRQTIY